MGYRDATDNYIKEHGGGPKCPFCGKQMFAADDHGRFICSCGQGFDGVLGVSTRDMRAIIPQIDAKKPIEKKESE